MGGRDDKKGRGWSMVFDDRTARNGGQRGGRRDDTRSERGPRSLADLGPSEVTDQHEAPAFPSEALEGPSGLDEADPPTVVDSGLREALDRELMPRTAGPATLADTDPDLVDPVGRAQDDRLANVAVALEESIEPAGGPVERTARTPSPFDVSVRPAEEHHETIPEGLVAPAEPRRPTDELLAEQSLPKIERPEPRGASPQVRPAGVVELTGPQEAPQERAERTEIDLAAALGMAPEKSTAAQKPVVSTVPAPRDEPRLRVPEKGAGFDFGPKAAKATPSNGAIAGPGEGARSDQLQNLTDTTQTLAKVLPIVLAIGVLLATVAVTLSLFSGQGHQEHVELRFLAVGGSQRSVVTRSTSGTPVTIETEPEGLLVMFDRQVLGKTPLQANLPVDIEDKVAVELSSPYFERYLSEIEREPTGGFKLVVKLARKAR